MLKVVPQPVEVVGFRNASFHPFKDNLQTPIADFKVRRQNIVQYSSRIAVDLPLFKLSCNRHANSRKRLGKEYFFDDASQFSPSSHTTANTPRLSPRRKI